MEKKKKKRHSKINEQIKRNLYTWITRHPQVVQSPISNDCLKVVLYDQTELTHVPKLLLQVSVRELHNSLVSDPNDGGLKDARDEDGKLLSVIPHCVHCCHQNLKKCLHVIRLCVVVNVASLQKAYILHCYHGVIGI